MTIVKKTHAIRYHAFSALDEEVGNLIILGATTHREAMRWKSFVILPQVKLLEAYCDLTGQRITMETLRTVAIEEILQGFVEAMAGKELIDLPERESVKFCRTIYQALTSARRQHPDLHPLVWDFTLFKPNAAVCTALASANQLKRWYWEGWTIVRPTHPGIYLRLSQIVVPYGHHFVSLVFQELEKYYRNRRGAFRSEWNYLFDYMGKHHASWPLAALQTEAGLKRFIQAFTVAYFTEAKDNNRDARSQIKNWNRFINSVETCLCKPDIWASLTSPIKRPPPSTKHGSETQVQELEDGLIVQEKLLTRIPLNITDNEAIDLLFFHIKKDLATVRGWADAQIEDLKCRHARRVSLAQEGAPIIKTKGRGLAKSYTLADICATLETNSSVPPSFLCEVYKHVTGEACNASQLAHIFGFPVTGSLFPFQCLLVLEHPEITTQFLKNFELYNQHGHMTGFDEEKRLLIGYKDRKQPNEREQIIELNDRSFSIVKDIIEITSLGRSTLLAQDENSYRHLFITSGRAFRPFRQAMVTIWNEDVFDNNSGLRAQLLRDFRPYSDLPDTELISFIKRVRLTKIRSSRAVDIFIQSKSSEQMSKALGHEHYYPDLLSHYLPDALLAFIKARWIRIFQKALVCEAMKDSPYLLRVSRFNSMEELDTFLDNHRIKEIPPQASDPERKAQRDEIETSEAVLSIGVPFLASLLSLEAAVKESSDRARVCGKAEYWASFAEKIKAEINGGFNRLLKKHLDAAMKLVDAKVMEELIYVPTHWS